MQDHKQHINNRLIITITLYSLSIGSRQTQHIVLHIDDLDHVRQLTRSNNEAQQGEDDHLATAMDPWSRGELLTHHSGGDHGDEESSGRRIPSPAGCRRRSPESPEMGFAAAASL